MGMTSTGFSEQPTFDAPPPPPQPAQKRRKKAEGGSEHDQQCVTRSNRISWTSKYGMSWFHCVWVKRQFVATPLVMQRQLSITQRDGRMGGMLV